MFYKLGSCEEKSLPEIVRRNLGSPQEGQPSNWYSPVGFREVTEAEIAQSIWGVYGPEFMEWRQWNFDGKDKPVINVNIFWFHDGTCIGLAFDYWGKKMRWFMGGCIHKYVNFRSSADLAKSYPEYSGMGNFGMHDRTSVCEKCRHFMCVDTSG